ncbi:MAG: hypothetical protein QNJ46_07775 [Leptolyngbyaceae cyanobacterium MO_188.B28]|nr:hypothetical protein [Leptolyngbyaceae cyanobacterium MO_188.B28]
MKLPRKSKQWLREIEKVVDDVSKQLEGHEKVSKAQFEMVLSVIADSISKNRNIEKTKILERSGEVVDALAEYLTSIPEEKRDWTGITAFLYMKFHQVLGLINEYQILKIFDSKLPFS